MTGHHPRLETLPADLRAMLPEDVPLRRRGEVDRAHFPGEALDRCFELFRGTVDPLAQAGRLGYVLFQLAPWGPTGRADGGVSRLALATAPGSGGRRRVPQRDMDPRAHGRHRPRPGRSRARLRRGG